MILKNIKVFLNEHDLNRLINNLNEKSVISIDTETSSLNPQEAELIGISVCYAPNISFYVPIGHKNTDCLKKI